MVQLRVIGEHVNVHSVLLNDFGKVHRIQNKETGTENQSLWHRAANVNHSLHGMIVNDAKRSALQI